MHAPDGLVNAPVSATMAAVALVVLGVALRRTGRNLDERRIPLAGLSAAFVFSAQMLNFPIAAGTSGHLIGGALAAVLLGPWLASVVMGVVIFTQALVFSDGGITALGINEFNMAIVTTFGGWSVYLACRRFLPSRGGSVVAATAIAGAASVVLSAVAFSVEWLFGATAPVAFDTVFASMVSVHLLIGVGEAVISGFVIAAILNSRPDLIYRSGDLPVDLADTRIGWRPFAIGSILAIVAITAIAAPFASSQPDGLERTIEATGMNDRDADQAASGVLSDYAIAGVSNPGVSRAVAGVGGAVVCAAVAAGMVRRGRTAKS